MRICAVVLIYIAASLSGSLIAEAQGWRGIEPLHSARADVERLLGPPAESTGQNSVLYKLANEVVTIDYASEPQCVNGYGWRVPKDTVLRVFISLRITLKVFELKLDETKYKRADNDNGPGVTYVNQEQGEKIEVFDNDVMGITYFPSAGDNKLRCPGIGPLTQDQSGQHDYHSLDTYHNIPFSAERKRLDNFSIHLQKNLDAVGYIIVYAGKRASIGEAQIRARRAKQYLVKRRGISTNRIVTMDGGYREKLTYELYLIPYGLPPPAPVPTVDRKDVQIISRPIRRDRN
jgi:hypothetical protein